MAEVNFPGNSHRSKEPAKDETVVIKKDKKIEPIVLAGTVVQQKPSLGRRIAATFSGDDARTVGTYVLFEVLLPAAKTMISDAASQGVERLLFGDGRPSRGRSGGSGYTSYGSYHQASKLASRREEPRQAAAPSRKVGAAFEGIILTTRGEAEEVLDRLQMLIDEYDVASVADLYQLVEITGSFTDDKWGWASIAGSGVRRVREGYALDLPRPMALD